VTDRQPVHVAYVPADRYHPASAAEWGGSALRLLDQHASTAPELEAALGLGLDPELAASVHLRLLRKLADEPVEDLRVDFEDGYGHHPDAEEDALARAAGASLATVATPACGIRVKAVEPATYERARRTLELVLDGAGGAPGGFVVTLPKAYGPDDVRTMDALCREVEEAHGIDPIQVEVQVETPQAVLALEAIAAAGEGRVVALHYGSYDYSAALGVGPAQQSLAHPVADHAKAVMQVVAAVHGLRVSDGSSNVLPVGSAEQVRSAWRLHAGLVRRSLSAGIPQGWDLHPGQLVSRHAATTAFYRAGLAEAVDRLTSYRDRAASGVLDEPATERALVGFLRRGLDCGALDTDEVPALG
jgi:citrate lyase beta subunit